MTTHTIAALAAEAADTYGEKPAVRVQRDGSWQDVSYSELGRIVREIGTGLTELIEPGDRVCLLANTRPEWTYVDLAITAAGGIVVPVYPTNAAEECEWVASDSGARVVVCEDADQAAKIAKVRDRLPDLQTVITIEDSFAGAVSLDEVRASGAAGDPAELDRRTAAVRPEDPYTFVYTSGTTGPPKGCVLTHANFAFVCDVAEELAVTQPGDVAYLYLPLAHVFARIVQTGSDPPGSDHRLLRGRHPPAGRRARCCTADVPAVGAADLREDLRHGAGHGGHARAGGAARAGRQGRTRGTPTRGAG